MGIDRRKFVRYQVGKSFRYKKITLADDKLIESKLLMAFSRNLSSQGILFHSNAPVALSSIIELSIDLKNDPVFKKKDFISPARKIFGKVVRLEDNGHGEYNIAVVFFNDMEQTAREIRDIRYKLMIQRFIALMTTGLFLFILTVILGIGVFINVQYRKLYVPDRNLTVTPSSIDISYEDVYFNTQDKESLNGWYIPSKDAKVTFLYIHGNEGNMSDRLFRLNFLHNMKFNIFIFDYRGYGKSSGRISEQGLYLDAQAAYDYLIHRDDIDKENIIAFGVSMGGAVATDLCLHRKLRALILESTFVSLLKQAQDLYPYIPVNFVLKEKYDTLSKIQRIHVPLLIFHGIEDEVVLFKHARLLFDESPYPKKFISFHGGHDDDVYKMSDAYKKDISQFLIENKIPHS